MKKYLLLKLCLLLFSFVGISQETTDTKKTNSVGLKMFVGPSINYSMGKIDLSENRYFRGVNLKPKNIGGGIVFSFQGEKPLFFQAEILYDKRTATDPEFQYVGSEPYSSVFKIDLSYIHIPILMGYAFNAGNNKPYIAGGLQFGQGLQQEMTNTYAADVPSFTPRSSPNVKYDASEIGFLILEVGIRKKIKNSNILNFSARYTASQRSIKANNDGSTNRDNISLATDKVAITLSYLFLLSKG